MSDQPSVKKGRVTYMRKVYQKEKEKTGMSYLSLLTKFIVSVFRLAEQKECVVDMFQVQQHYKGARAVYDILGVLRGLNMIRRIPHEDYEAYGYKPASDYKSKNRKHKGTLYEWVGEASLLSYMKGVEEWDLGVCAEKFMSAKRKSVGMIQRKFPRSSVTIEPIEETTPEEVDHSSSPDPCACHACLYSSHSIPPSHPDPYLITSPSFDSYLSPSPVYQYDAPTSPSQQSSQAPTERDGYPTPSSFSPSEEAEDYSTCYPRNPSPLPDTWYSDEHFESTFGYATTNKRRRVVS